MPDSYSTLPKDADARYAELGGSHDAIPQGSYCYSWVETELGEGEPEFMRRKVKPCPYWGCDPSKTEMEGGYCALLKRGDWDDGCSLLWDQVKECGINDEIEDDEEALSE